MTEAERDRLRALARAEVEKAPPPTPEQLALVAALLGPAVSSTL